MRLRKGSENLRAKPGMKHHEDDRAAAGATQRLKQAGFGCSLAKTFRFGDLEARVGIEPTRKGFADLSLTTWVPRPGKQWLVVSGEWQAGKTTSLLLSPLSTAHLPLSFLERETGFEPATSTLARSHSTTELLPPACQENLFPLLRNYKNCGLAVSSSTAC